MHSNDYHPDNWNINIKFTELYIILYKGYG